MKNCLDKIDKGICKGDCCGAVPFTKKLVYKNRDRIIRSTQKKFELENNMVVHITEDASCIFLTSEYKCNIYDDRPELCRLFGTFKDKLLVCPHKEVSDE